MRQLLRREISKYRIVRFGHVLVVGLLLMAPAVAVAGAEEEANAAIDRWSAAYSANDVDAVVRSYWPDAILLGHGDGTFDPAQALALPDLRDLALFALSDPFLDLRRRESGVPHGNLVEQTVEVGRFQRRVAYDDRRIGHGHRGYGRAFTIHAQYVVRTVPDPHVIVPGGSPVGERHVVPVIRDEQLGRLVERDCIPNLGRQLGYDRACI